MSRRKYGIRSHMDYVCKRQAAMWNYYIHTLRHDRGITKRQVAGRFYSLPYGLRLLDSMESAFRMWDDMLGVRNSPLPPVVNRDPVPETDYMDYLEEDPVEEVKERRPVDWFAGKWWMTIQSSTQRLNWWEIQGSSHWNERHAEERAIMEDWSAERDRRGWPDDLCALTGGDWDRIVSEALPFAPRDQLVDLRDGVIERLLSEESERRQSHA